MWKAWNAARTWKCRPSEVYHIEDDFAAYCFDSAVATFGQALDNELQGVKGKNDREIEGKRKRIIERWIPELKRAGTQEQRFRDPMEKFGVL